MATKPLRGINLGSHVAIHSDRSVHINQRKKRDSLSRRYSTYGLARGAIIRQLGVARATSKYQDQEMFAVYFHSQITDDPRSDGYASGGMFLDRDDTEQLVTMMLGALAERDE